MTELAPQKDVMDVLQAWVDDYNRRAEPGIRLGSAGEAGGAQLRRKYSPTEGQVSVLHLVAGERGGRAAILVPRVDAPAPETAVGGGRGSSGGVGRAGAAC